MHFYKLRDKKARFTRIRAAREWSPPYQGSCIDPMDQSQPLDLALKASGARRIPAIRLLIKDYKNILVYFSSTSWNTSKSLRLKRMDQAMAKQTGIIRLTPTIQEVKRKRKSLLR